MTIRDLIPWRREQELWDPFEDVHSMMDPFAGTFAGAWPVLSAVSLLGGTAKWTPQVDIKESEKEFRVSVSIPGVDKKDLHVDINDGVLVIRGERKRDQEYEDEDKDGGERTEQACGSFTRSFTLPTAVDAEGVSAAYKDGVLNVRIPKSKETAGRSIGIK